MDWRLTYRVFLELCVKWKQQWFSINGSEETEEELYLLDDDSFSNRHEYTSGWHTQSNAIHLSALLYSCYAKNRENDDNWSLITWKISISPHSRVLHLRFIYTSLFLCFLYKIKIIKMRFQSKLRVVQRVNTMSLRVSFGGLKSNNKHSRFSLSLCCSVSHPLSTHSVVQIYTILFICLNLLVITYKQIKLFGEREWVRN